MRKHCISKTFLLVFAISFLFAVLLLKSVAAHVEGLLKAKDKRNEGELETHSFMASKFVPNGADDAINADENVATKHSSAFYANNGLITEGNESSDSKSNHKKDNADSFYQRKLSVKISKVMADNATQVAVNTVVKNLFTDLYKEAIKPLFCALRKKVNHFVSNKITHKNNLKIFDAWHDYLLKHLLGDNATSNKIFNKKIKHEFIECCKSSWEESPIVGRDNLKNILRVVLIKFKPFLLDGYSMYDQDMANKYETLLENKIYFTWVDMKQPEPEKSLLK